MTSMELIGLNTKWFRYQQNITQEEFAYITKFKMAYISTIETGIANLNCKNIDLIAKSLNTKPKQLFDENTAIKAKELICITKKVSKIWKCLLAFFISLLLF